MDYELKKEARELLEKRLKIQQKSFSQGRISTRELIMSQSEYHGARMKEAAAILEYVKAGSAWNTMTGKYDVYFDQYMAKAKN
jgi:outer membrane protein TolC